MYVSEVSELQPAYDRWQYVIKCDDKRKTFPDILQLLHSFCASGITYIAPSGRKCKKRMSEEECPRFTLKLALVGDCGVGKSSLSARCNRYLLY